MFRSQDQLVEETWLRASANKSEAVKQMSRTDLQACVSGACERLAVKVANQPNYHLLLRAFPALAEQVVKPMVWLDQWHPTQGAGLGISQLEGEVQAIAAGARATAAEWLFASGDTAAVRSARFAWHIKALGGHAVGLTRASAEQFAANHAENQLVIDVTNAGIVSVWQQGAIIEANVATVLAAQTIQVEIDASGAVTLSVSDSAGVQVGDAVVLASVPAVEADCFLAVHLASTNTILARMVVAQGHPRRAVLQHGERLLKETVQTRGYVAFLPPWTSDEEMYVVPLTHAEAATYQAYPRLNGFWYWAWDESVGIGSVVRAFPGGEDDLSREMPSNRLEVVGVAIPTWADIPAQLHEALVLELIAMAAERGGMAKDGKR